MADNLTVATEEGDAEVATKDAAGVHHQKTLTEIDVGGTPTVVSAAAPMPVADTALAGFVDGLEGLMATLGGYLDGLEGGIGTSGDAAATQGSTGTLSAKLRTVTAQLNTLVGHVDGIETLLTAVDGHVDGLEGKDFATQTTLAAILAAVDGLEGFTDGLESAFSTLNGKDFATQTTLAAILAAVDGLEGFTDGLEGQLTTLAGYLDSVETLLGAATSGGWTAHRRLSTANTNTANIKGSAGQVGGWYLYNANAAVRYLKLYDKATSPTLASDTPLLTIPIPPGAGANVEVAKGIVFGTGISLAITTGVADTDTGSVAANEIVVNLLYK